MKPMACALLVWACLAIAAAAARAEPAASCQAERVGDRAEVRVALSQLFDRELLHLVQLGLEGRIHLEVTLYRRRRFWFDERRALETRELGVAWSRGDGRFLLDGHRLDDAADLRPEPLSLRTLADGAHYVEVSARLEVVTAKSLGQMARWLVRRDPGDGGEASSTLGSSVLSYVAAGLVRTAATRCPVRS